MLRRCGSVTVQSFIASAGRLQMAFSLSQREASVSLALLWAVAGVEGLNLAFSCTAFR